MVRFALIAKSSPPAKEFPLRELIEVRPVGQFGPSLPSRHFAHSARRSQVDREDGKTLTRPWIGRSRRGGKRWIIAGLMADAPDLRVAAAATIAGRVLGIPMEEKMET